MTSSIVCDASLLLASALSEAHTLKARNVIQVWERQQMQLAAPFLLHYEIVAVVRRNVFQNRLTVAEGIPIRDSLLKIPVRLMMDDALLLRAYELAT